GLIGALVTVIVLVIVGVIAYNVGWSDGVNTHLPAGTATAPGPYYGYGYGFHPFFAGFGILWFLFILFGIFFLLRLAFFGRMWRGSCSSSATISSTVGSPCSPRLMDRPPCAPHARAGRIWLCWTWACQDSMG